MPHEKNRTLTENLLAAFCAAALCFGVPACRTLDGSGGGNGGGNVSAPNAVVSSAVRGALPRSDIMYVRILRANAQEISAEVDLASDAGGGATCVPVRLTNIGGTFALSEDSRARLEAGGSGEAAAAESSPKTAADDGRFLVKRAADPSVSPEALFRAVEANDLEGVLRAIDSGVDVSKKLTQTSLRANNPNKERVVVRDDTPLAVAARNKSHAIAQALLNAGADPNQRFLCAENGYLLTRTAVFFAAENDDAEMIRLLARYNLNADFAQTAVWQNYSVSNVPCTGTQTALGIAVSRGNAAAVQALLAAGAKVDADFAEYVRRDHTRKSPETVILALACRNKGDTKMLNLLTDAGANLNKAWTERVGSWGVFGFTALCFAVDADDLPLVKKMLSLGADPNLTAPANKDYRGRYVNSPTRTAIFYAKTPEMAQALLDAGADVNYVFQGGGSRTGTALDFCKDPVMRDFLVSKGAKSASAAKTVFR